MTEPFNQEEFDKYLAAVNQLSNQTNIPINISERAAFFIIAQIQLAFRHPNNNGPGRDVVRQTIQPIVDYFTGDAREILERGFHPEFDVKADVNQPDPNWDYYEVYQKLQSVKNKIDAALGILSKTEQADNDVDQKVLEILQPAIETFGEVVDEDLLFDDDIYEE